MDTRIFKDYYSYIKSNRVRHNLLKSKNHILFNDGTGIELNEQHSKLQEKCVRELKKEYPDVSENSIISVLFSQVNNVNLESFKLRPITRKLTTYNKELTIILPNHSVILEGLQFFSFGDVECCRSELLKKKFMLNKRISINSSKLGWSKGGKSFYLPEYSFIVKVYCSPDNAEGYAMKKVYLFIGLIRLFLRTRNLIDTFFPHNGRVETNPFVPACNTNKYINR